MRIKFMIYAVVAIISLGLIPATQVRADSLDSFVYQFGGNTFTWELPSSPSVAPDNAYSGVVFTLDDVSVSKNGGPAVLGTMDFWSTLCAGGVDFYVGNYSYLFNTTGPQLYSGSVNSPTFRTGTFTSLVDYGNGFVGVPGGTLKVSTAVPEPSALLLLAIGLILALALSVVLKHVPIRSLS